jgi:serine/threonine protein kinase
LFGTELIGKTIDGRFKILEVLGTGGMGTVYKAHDDALPRDVALKILSTGNLNESARLRFEREGKILAALKHKSIITIYFFGFLGDSSPYIAMELLEGKTLRAVLLEETKISWQRTADIAIQICEAMQCAHDAGIVHRDLKPENLMLQNNASTESVKVFDFGLAGIMPEGDLAIQKLTVTGELIGSINYISPEQCKGKKADFKSDIYALGCILYECLIGEPPFSADNPIGLVYKHANEAQRDFSKFECARGIPSELEQIVAKCMMKDPQLRYESMHSLALDLQSLLDGTLEKISTQPTASQKHKFSPVWMASLASLVFIIAGIFIAQKLITKKKTELEKPRPTIQRILKKAYLSGFLFRESPSPELCRQLSEMLSSNKLTDGERAQALALLASQTKIWEKGLVLECSARKYFRKAPISSYPHYTYMACIQTLKNLTSTDLPQQAISLNKEIQQFLKSNGFNQKDKEYDLNNVTSLEYLTIQFQASNVLLLKQLNKNDEAVKLLNKLAKQYPDLEGGFLHQQILLGQLDSARAAISKCTNTKTLIDISGDFRQYNLNSDAMVCLNRASMDSRAIELTIGEFVIASALLLVNQGQYEKAAAQICNLANLDLHSRSSINRRVSGPELIVVLMATGHETDALKLLDRYDREEVYQHPGSSFRLAIMGSEEAHRLDELKNARDKIFTKSIDEQLHFARIGSNDTLARKFTAAHLYNLATSKDCSKLSPQQKCEILIEWIHVNWFGIPQQILRTCDLLIADKDAKHCQPANYRNQEGLNYQQLGYENKAHILRETGKAREAADILKLLYKEMKGKNLCGASLVFTECVYLQNISAAKDIANSCEHIGELCYMARNCLRMNEPLLAQFCLDRARKLNADSGELLDIKTSTALQYLENQDISAARNSLANLDLKGIENPELMHRLVLALCFAEMLDEASAVTKKFEKWN